MEEERSTIAMVGKSGSGLLRSDPLKYKDLFQTLDCINEEDGDALMKLDCGSLGTHINGIFLSFFSF